MPASRDDILSPELIRILKIFGLASFGLVLLLSFFNEKRANNTGLADSPMHVNPAESIYFKNVRAAYYDQEIRRDAKMLVYRHGKRSKDLSKPSLSFSILLNGQKEEAYIFAEPHPEGFPILLKYVHPETGHEEELEFQGGNKFDHFDFAQKVHLLLEEDYIFEIWFEGKWNPIFEDPKVREATLTTFKDYHRLLGKD